MSRHITPRALPGRCRSNHDPLTTGLFCVFVVFFPFFPSGTASLSPTMAQPLQPAVLEHQALKALSGKPLQQTRGRLQEERSLCGERGPTCCGGRGAERVPPNHPCRGDGRTLRGMQAAGLAPGKGEWEVAQPRLPPLGPGLRPHWALVASQTQRGSSQSCNPSISLRVAKSMRSLDGVGTDGWARGDSAPSRLADGWAGRGAGRGIPLKTPGWPRRPCWGRGWGFVF